MNKAGERLYNGIIKENPTFVLMLGMCPTLAVTTSAMNGLGMGLTTAVVLTMSNLIISLLRKVIPSRVRIPAFIVIIASFVTAVQLLLQAYLPSLNDALGVYIPLIVVNCIILGRAESYAYSNPPIPSLFDGLGMGLGFSLALTCIGAVREILAAGSIFGFRIMPDSYVTINIFGLAPGAFFVLAALTALQNYIKNKRKLAGKDLVADILERPVEPHTALTQHARADNQALKMDEHIVPILRGIENQRLLGEALHVGEDLVAPRGYEALGCRALRMGLEILHQTEHMLPRGPSASLREHNKGLFGFVDLLVELIGRVIEIELLDKRCVHRTSYQ